MRQLLQFGEVAKLIGVSAKTVRYYHEIGLLFSEKGQVLLRLDQTYPFRVGLFGTGNAEQILINVDDRDEFLAALHLLDCQRSGEGQDRTGTRPLPSHPTAPCPYISGGPTPQLALDSPLPTISGTSTESPTRMLVSAEDKASTRETLSGGQVTTKRDSFAASKVAIRTENLTRRYNNLVAVDNLNLAIRPGEIYGFLGANGAGKTTTMKMLVGLLEPHAGRAEIGGHDIWKNPLAAKAVLGYVADRAMLNDRLTGREFLMFLAQLRNIPRQQAEKDIDHLLNMLELADRAQSQCATYSYGMKRKLALAAALLHHPSVLILDEPLNGLDPLSARRLKDLFADLAADGTAIFLSTHDLATAESLCHRVGIISYGCLLVEGSAHELREIAAAPDLESVFLALTAEQAEVLA